jgi:YD repeat-containing protein
LAAFTPSPPRAAPLRTHAYDRQRGFETLTVDGANTYTHGYQDADPRMGSLTRPNGSQTAYDYDGLNRLKQIAHRNAAEQLLGQFDFEYNDQDLIERETIASLEAVSGLANGETQYTPNDLNQLWATTNPARDYAYGDDAKGNVSRIVDGAQAVVATYRYDVFGNLKVASGSLDQPFRFSTKRYFADLGLNYYGYRYYGSGHRALAEPGSAGRG